MIHCCINTLISSVLLCRNLIESNRADEKFAGLELSERQKSAILKFADDFQLNELTCLKLWIHVSQDENRRQLEKDVGMKSHSLDGKIAHAAAEYYYYDNECLLRSLLNLIKLRYDASLCDWERDVVMQFTNRLLRKNVIINILNSIKFGVDLLGSTEIVSRRLSYFHRCLRYLADCLFFLAYQTQYEDAEVLELERVIQSMCIAIATPRGALKGRAQFPVDASCGAIPAVSRVNSMVTDVQSQLMPVFVVLQLTHVSALNVCVDLFSRHCDTEPYCIPDSSGIRNKLTLVTSNMDMSGRCCTNADGWASPGVYGLICLSYASLCQHLGVDCGGPLNFLGSQVENCAEVVQNYMLTSVRCRVFSYIRLCLLPILQSSFITEPDDCYSSLSVQLSNSVASSSVSFYSDVLEECVFRRLSELFMMPMHLGEFSGSRYGFPFIPLSQQRYYRDELSYYQEQQEQFELDQQQRRLQLEEEEEELDQDERDAEEEYRYHNSRGKPFMTRQQKQQKEQEKFQRQQRLQHRKTSITAADIAPIDCQEDVLQMFSEYFRGKPSAVYNYLSFSGSVFSPFIGRIIRSIGEDASSLTAPALLLLAACCYVSPTGPVVSGLDLNFANKMVGNAVPMSNDMESLSSPVSYRRSDDSFDDSKSQSTAAVTEMVHNVSTSSVIFTFLMNKDNTGGKLDWAFIFLALDNYIQELGGSFVEMCVSEQDAAATGTGSTPMKNGYFSGSATPGVRTPIASVSNTPFQERYRTPLDSARKFSSSNAPGSASRQSQPKKKRKVLAGRDTDALLSIMELLTSIVAASTYVESEKKQSGARIQQERQLMMSNVDYILNQYQPIRKLFSLLCNCSASLPLQLKGKIFHALAAFAYYAGINNISSIQNEIWQLMEIHGVLIANATDGATGVASHQGLKYELDTVESTEGNYPVTDGFLTLIEMLITYATNANKDVGASTGARSGFSSAYCSSTAPSSDASIVLSYVGYEIRIPGINVYINHILDEILFKSHLRYYATTSLTGGNSSATGNNTNVAYNYEGSAQRLKIVAKCLRIVTTVIQQYNVNILESLTPAQIQEQYEKQQKQQDNYFENNRVRIELDMEIEEQEDEELLNNNINGVRISGAKRLMKELLLDFNDNIIFDYPITFQSGSHGSAAGTTVAQAVRPKSAGFFIMAKLLDSDSKLLYYIIQLLCEFNTSTMLMQHNCNSSQRSQSSMTSYIASKRVSDLIYASSASQQILHMQKEQRHGSGFEGGIGNFFNSSVGVESGSQRCDGESNSFLLPIFSDLLINQHTMMLDYTSMQSCYNSKYYTDINYWQQKIAMYCVGILYEASVRENVFLKLVHSQPMMTKRVNTVTPINMQPLSMLLTSKSLFKKSATAATKGAGCDACDPTIFSSSTSTALTLISSFLSVSNVSSAQSLWCANCSPTIPIMVIKLLQHITTSIMNNYSPSEGASVLHRLFGENSSNNVLTTQIIGNNFVVCLLESGIGNCGDNGSLREQQVVSSVPLMVRYNVDAAYFFHNSISILTPPSKLYSNAISNRNGRIELLLSINESVCGLNELPDVAKSTHLANEEPGDLVDGAGGTGLVLKTDAYRLSNMRYAMLQMLMECLSASNSSSIPTVTFAHYLLFGVETVNTVYSHYSNKSSNDFGSFSSPTESNYCVLLKNKKKEHAKHGGVLNTDGGLPSCCLDVILQYLNPVPTNVAGEESPLSIVLTNPEEALLCYEIMYLLYKDIVFSGYMFDLCLQDSVLFSIQQLYILVDYYYYKASPSALGSNRITIGGDATGVTRTNDFMLLKENSYRNNCCAWLLKIIALEVHHFESQSLKSSPRNYDATNGISNYLMYLLGVKYPSIVVQNNNSRNIVSASNEDEHNNELKSGNPLFLILQHAIRYNEEFVYNVPAVFSGSGDSIINYCMNEANVDYNVWSFSQQLYTRSSYAAASGGGFARNLGDLIENYDLVGPIPVGFKTVIVEDFLYLYDKYSGPVSGRSSSKVSPEVRRNSILKDLIGWNIYNMMMASYAHVAVSWRNIIDSIVYHCGNLLIRGSGAHGNLAKGGGESSFLSEVVESLVLPTAGYALLASSSSSGGSTAAQIDMCVGEPIVHSLYSLVHLIQYASHSSTDAPSLPVTTDNWLTLPQFNQLVGNIMQMILRGVGGHNGLPLTTVQYRISLYHALLSLLQYGTRTVVASEDNDDEDVREFFTLMNEYQEILMVSFVLLFYMQFQYSSVCNLPLE